MSNLEGKHIVLGITGSIAAYKAAILIRLLIRRGAEVQVVITPAGKEFITPITLSALTQKPVISEFFSQRDGTWNSHVDLGLWADLMLVAPATASTLGKMANGIADDLVSTLLLATDPKRILAAPAMNEEMCNHPANRRNVSRVQEDGVTFIGPGSGWQACRTIGVGRMSESAEIIEAVARRLLKMA